VKRPLKIIPNENKDTRDLLKTPASSALIWFAALKATHNKKAIPAKYIALEIRPLFIFDHI
jgi:hypothetical protein